MVWIWFVPTKAQVEFDASVVAVAGGAFTDDWVLRRGRCCCHETDLVTVIVGVVKRRYLLRVLSSLCVHVTFCVPPSPVSQMSMRSSGAMLLDFQSPEL